MHQRCSNYALTNLLFGLCRSVWVIYLLVNLPSPHPRALARPSTPKVLWVRERAPTPSFFVVFTFGLSVESIKEFGGVLIRAKHCTRVFAMGCENTLRGGQQCCHIVLFSRGCPCLNFNHGNIGAYFFNFFHNMLDHNTKNSIAKIYFFPTYIVRFQSIFVAKKCMLLCTKKCKYTKKMIEMSFRLYEICSIY